MSSQFIVQKNRYRLEATPGKERAGVALTTRPSIASPANPKTDSFWWDQPEGLLVRAIEGLYLVANQEVKS